MYGYNDYHGIAQKCDAHVRRTNRQGLTKTSKFVEQKQNESDFNSNKSSSDEEELNVIDNLPGGHWIEGDSLAPPCGSEIEAVHTLLDLANLQHDDILYDLGCGDGRVCLEAFSPMYGCGKCVGVEIEEDLVHRFQCLIEEIPDNYFNLKDDYNVFQSESNEVTNEHVEEEPYRQIKAIQADLRDVDLQEATVICLYLLPEAIAMIEEKLIKLLQKSPRLRILCNSWGLRSIKAIKSSDVPGTTTSMFLYTEESLKEISSVTLD